MSSFFRIVTSQTGFRVTLAAAVATVYNTTGNCTCTPVQRQQEKQHSQKQQHSLTNRYVAYCDAAAATNTNTTKSTRTIGTENITTIENSKSHHTIRHGGQMNSEQDGDYYGLFPLRQLFIPYMEYPLWDDNWDERKVEDMDKKQYRHIRKTGITRHIILIRHGQYDETNKVREAKVVWGMIYRL
jgi:hypothetical protein